MHKIGIVIAVALMGFGLQVWGSAPKPNSSSHSNALFHQLSSPTETLNLQPTFDKHLTCMNTTPQYQRVHISGLTKLQDGKTFRVATTIIHDHFNISGYMYVQLSPSTSSTATSGQKNDHLYCLRSLGDGLGDLSTTNPFGLNLDKYPKERDEAFDLYRQIDFGDYASISFDEQRPLALHVIMHRAGAKHVVKNLKSEKKDQKKPPESKSSKQRNKEATTTTTTNGKTS